MAELLRLRTEGLDWREVEGEVVIADRRTSHYLAVNRTATLLWPVLAEGATEEQLIELLRGEFRLERDMAERDVRAFLNGLRARGLLA